jgi:hypothetical protein
MDLFEYILIMTSVIFAMAVGQLLLGLARWAQATARVRTYLPHAVWGLVLFVMIFANWWANWEFRAIAWTLPMYAYMLMAPTLFFFVCTLLTPQSFEQEEVDLEAHFFRVRRPFFAAFFVGALAILIDGFLMGTESAWHLGRIGHAAILAGILGGLVSDDRTTHRVLPWLVLSGLVGAMSWRLWTPAG